MALSLSMPLPDLALILVQAAYLPNEFFDQQDEADKERIADTNFTAFGKIPKKYHIECESSLSFVRSRVTKRTMRPSGVIKRLF